MSEREPEARLWEMMSAHYYSRGLYCAALLKLPDHLKDGPRTAAELAQLANAISACCTGCYGH